MLSTLETYELPKLNFVCLDQLGKPRLIQIFLDDKAFDKSMKLSELIIS